MSHTPKSRTPEELAYIDEHLEYRDGVVFWKKVPPYCKRVKIGDIAGSLHKISGYHIIMVKYKRIKRAHITWYLTKRAWPNKQTDHIDGNRINDNIENLRLVTPRENNQNMKGHRNGRLPGTFRNRPGRTAKWCAQIHINSRSVHLGSFSTEQEAHEAYLKAVSELDSSANL